MQSLNRGDVTLEEKKDSMITFIPLNTCTRCKGKLVAIETETSVIALDNTGYPIGRDNLFIELYLKCTDCDRTSDVDIKAMRYVEVCNMLPKVEFKRKVKNPFGSYD